MRKQTLLTVLLNVLIFGGMFLIPEFLDGKARRIAQVILFVLLVIISVVIARTQRHSR